MEQAVRSVIIMSRYITLPTKEAMMELDQALRQYVTSNNGEIDSSTEDIFDSEFNRIYIAYYYSNIGNPQ
jgi:hypothetical protein